MFDLKHHFLRSALKLFLLFILVELSAWGLLQNWEHTDEKTRQAGQIHWDPALPAPPKIELNQKALTLYIPAGFALFLLMGFRIAREGKESAEKRLQRYFPYFKTLVNQGTTEEISQWLFPKGQVRPDLKGVDKLTLLSYLKQEAPSAYHQIKQQELCTLHFKKQIQYLEKLW